MIFNSIENIRCATSNAVVCPEEEDDEEEGTKTSHHLRGLVHWYDVG